MDKKFWDAISKNHAEYGKHYRKLVGESNDALNASKRAIFALHRGDLKQGRELLEQATTGLAGLRIRFKDQPMLQEEGAYRAAVEEFVEANLFEKFLSKKSLGEIKGIASPEPEVYLAGLADVPGELVRYAVARATAGDMKEVMRAEKESGDIIGFLISLDLTGYLRTKFDQAKNSMRRMEEIAYDVALKGRK